MRRRTDRILTTHVGALPDPVGLAEGVRTDDDLRAAVRQVVQRQRDAGIDFVNEGELTKGGNFVTYINERLSGFEAGDASVMTSVLTSSRDWTEFADFYGKAVAKGTLFEQTGSLPSQVPARRMELLCRGPIRYTGTAVLRREIDALRSALDGHPPADAFLTTTAPASIEVGRKNEYYHRIDRLRPGPALSSAGRVGQARCARRGHGSVQSCAIRVARRLQPARVHAAHGAADSSHEVANAMRARAAERQQ